MQTTPLNQLDQGHRQGDAFPHPFPPVGEEATTTLSAALSRLFEMDAEDAEEVSSFVMDAFAGADEVHDERLDQDLRSIFYTLEAKRLVTFRREEYNTESGERRRAFFWRLRMDHVRDVARDASPRRAMNVYHTLPASAWTRRAS